MNKISSRYLIYYSKEVVEMLMEKYDFSFFEAYRKFLNSKTYKLIEDKNCAMYEFGSPAIFDILENELITGVPQNSVYLRSID